GPSSVYGEGAPQVEPAFFDLNFPMLGICYGMQLMGQQLGGRVQPSVRREYGRAILQIDDLHDLFHQLPSETVVWMSHGDQVIETPPGFKILAHSSNTPVAAFGDAVRKRYGVQFHPEVTHTQNGGQMLKNFLFRICGCQADWTMESFIETETRKIK